MNSNKQFGGQKWPCRMEWVKSNVLSVLIEHCSLYTVPCKLVFIIKYFINKYLMILKTCQCILTFRMIKLFVNIYLFFDRLDCPLNY